MSYNMISERFAPTRSDSSSFKRRAVFVTVRVILFLIFLQVLVVFSVALNLGSDGLEQARYLLTPAAGNSSSSSSWFLEEEDTETGNSEEGDGATREERLKKIELLDDNDPRQERVLYDKGSSKSSNTHEEQSSLDDYGSRRHLPWKNFTPMEDGPYLIVGGSDGSGTRAVVDTLIDLGAAIRVEDPRTKDVHGTEMFHKAGWPPLVYLALQQTRSANYELSDMTESSRDEALSNLKRLKKSIDLRAPFIFKSRVRDADDENPFATAFKVGWKAPVSMFVMPMLQNVFGRVKYLHVVRDGRDVCLSENQSPVRKFYNTFYGLTKEGQPGDNNITTLSMKLWNDVNQQVMEWGKAHSDGETFDYLTLRSEDLVNPNTRFETLLQLADFIGSRKTLRELCCMSQQELHDLGKSLNGFSDPRKKRGGHQRRGVGLPFDSSKEDFVNDLLFGLGKDARMPGSKNHREKRFHRRRNKQDLTEEGQRIRRQGALRHLNDDPLRRHGGALGMQRRLLQQNDGAEEHRDEISGSTPHRRLQPQRSRLRELFYNSRLGHGARRHNFVKEAPEQVKARYGKWVKALEDKPELSAQLHDLGKSGLEAFGYEPPRAFLDPPDETYLEQCQKMLNANLCDE
ncbi:expressed unknown protein [Seminavis robusta]|uniref:Sulfotransferase domain-containing protein n=1 Tax=Seminavis robusta TaxID=568900 RepID=A0A9N8DYW1_9STRA|nr:expressed unknown protein [Seminavis robusta]|eukprot:Sro461_g147800.1 n/a (628) ;mRNA; r:40709-42706